MAAIGEASSTPAIRRIELPRWLQPGALAGALLALLVLTISPAPSPTARTATTLRTLPLAAQSLVSRTLGRDESSYRVHRSGNVLVARNAPQGIAARFGPQGPEVRAGRDTLSLRLRGVPPVTPVVHANRVLYQRGSMTEWYANGPLGLEQGFTLKARPAARGVGR